MDFLAPGLDQREVDALNEAKEAFKKLHVKVVCFKFKAGNAAKKTDEDGG